MNGADTRYVPEWYQGPGEANQAWVSVGVSDELPPHHDQDKPGHYAGWRHGFWLSIIPLLGFMGGDVLSIGKAELVPLQVIFLVLPVVVHWNQKKKKK